MNKLTTQLLIAFSAICLIAPTMVSFGQEQAGQAEQAKSLAYEDWYGDVKKTLADHYTGKTVKLKMPIPATRRGLEMVDGALNGGTAPVSAEMLAQSGDDVTIKSFIVRDQDIELLLNKNGEKPKGWFFPKKPRIKLRFSRELAAKDLTIEAINRWLSPAIDVASLASAGEQNSTQASVAIPATAPKEAMTKPVANPSMENPKGLPTPSIINDLANGVKGFAELTIECPGKYARVYIDDAYSGYAPRTITVKAGIHSILVMADGYSAWEQRLFIPGGKAAVVKAEPIK